MRQTKTLLKILRTCHLKDSEKGLCGRAYRLVMLENRVSSEEYNTLTDILDENRPKDADKYYPFWFRTPKARTKFIDRLIKKYEKVKK